MFNRIIPSHSWSDPLYCLSVLNKFLEGTRLSFCNNAHTSITISYESCSPNISPQQNIIVTKSCLTLIDEGEYFTDYSCSSNFSDIMREKLDIHSVLVQLSQPAPPPTHTYISLISICVKYHLVETCMKHVCGIFFIFCYDDDDLIICEE